MRFSIKIKLTIFIIIMLSLSVISTGFMMLKGIEQNQKDYYETLLLENSKIANLYIREEYESSDYDDFSLFYQKESDKLVISLNKMFHMPLELYDSSGNLLSSGETIINESRPLEIMKKAIKDQVIYQKLKDKIIFLAPIYNYDYQIGILKITYSVERENHIYERLQDLFLKIGALFIIVSGFIGIYIFMSEKIKQNVDELTKEKEKLNLVINQLKTLEKQQKEFIGNITHEFKTPLTVIKSQIDLITMYMDDKEMVERAKIIADKELIRMDSMIQNILYLSRIEKYDFDFEKEIINVKDILEEICNRMEAKANKFDISIIKDLEDIKITIDKESFMQIFINLIDNAIKYNKNQGKIYVRAFRKKEVNVIEIEDTGIGIPKEFKDRIFEPFFTVDKNRSKNFSGTGLGLSLVQKLVESQSGSIELLKYEDGVKFEIKFYNIKIKAEE